MRVPRWRRSWCVESILPASGDSTPARAGEVECRPKDSPPDRAPGWGGRVRNRGFCPQTWIVWTTICQRRQFAKPLSGQALARSTCSFTDTRAASGAAVRWAPKYSRTSVDRKTCPRRKPGISAPAAAQLVLAHHSPGRDASQHLPHSTPAASTTNEHPRELWRRLTPDRDRSGSGAVTARQAITSALPLPPPVGRVDSRLYMKFTAGVCQ